MEISKENMDRIREFLVSSNNDNNVLIHNPTGLYYLKLGEGMDAEHQRRKIVILRSIPSGRLWVTSLKAVSEEIDVNGTTMPRFSVAVDDDKAIGCIMEYMDNGLRV